jgi:hypothetical protein
VIMDWHDWVPPHPNLWVLRDNKTLHRVDGFTAEWIESQRKYHQIALSLIGPHGVVDATIRDGVPEFDKPPGSVSMVVSTVFLGVGIGLHGSEPFLFETMVFARGSSAGEVDATRYRSFAEAELGHRAMVAKWRVVAAA